jgi:hypothetical protein
MTTKAPPEPTGGALFQLNTSSHTATTPSSKDATDNKSWGCEAQDTGGSARRLTDAALPAVRCLSQAALVDRNAWICTDFNTVATSV